MQVEYSLGFVVGTAAELAPVYAEISRQAILTVKAPDVAKFLGKRFPAQSRSAGQRLPHPHGGHADQTLAGTGLAQALRQTRAGVAPGMHRQRRHLFFTLPQGGTSGRTADL